MLWFGEPEHARREREEGEHDALDASLVGEATERQEEEGPYVPAQCVVASPGPREESVEKFYRSSSLVG